MRSKAVIHVNHAEHQRTHGVAMKSGLERHGIEVEFARFNSPQPCDFAVIWGVKQPAVIESAPRVLVMERGHVPDRMVYTSCGWDGLGGRGKYPSAPDGERWERLFSHLMRPWKDSGDYALLIGQVVGDASLYGLSEGFPAWAERMTRELRHRGWAVRYRPHPLMARNNDQFCPEGATRSVRPLSEDLEGAGMAVTFNSTTGVEAVLAGVPTVTMDQGAMAWPVASHDLDGLIRPDRTEWARDMAYTQWTMDEIAAGETWAHLRDLL